SSLYLLWMPLSPEGHLFYELFDEWLWSGNIFSCTGVREKIEIWILGYVKAAFNLSKRVFFDVLRLNLF
ncbi:MAG: hypothetical protein IJF43_06615, partial [Firmicutes bacterium]|nr:hypothetical protein [Bacillota bacterium]